ncbi:hypothetical protein V2J09_007770 [Rumex salicifolius]
MADRRLPYPPCQSGACLGGACCAAGGRFRWPELVGEDVQKAKAVIESTNRISTVVILEPGQTGMGDFCCNRVYVVIDSQNRVIRIPFVG